MYSVDFDRIRCGVERIEVIRSQLIRRELNLIE
jgi:hypothetical protein